MNPATRPLLSLTAADLMTESVVMVPEEMSVQGAAKLLTQSRVTGAPVVNHEGRLVGVISSVDFVRFVNKKRPGSGSSPDWCAAWQIVDPSVLPEDAVGHFMTRDSVAAHANTTVGELSRMMVDAHIHRVIVIDQESHPIGVVSSTDILAALARADQMHAKESPNQNPEMQPC